MYHAISKVHVHVQLCTSVTVKGLVYISLAILLVLILLINKITCTVHVHNYFSLSVLLNVYSNKILSSSFFVHLGCGSTCNCGPLFNSFGLSILDITYHNHVQ